MRFKQHLALLVLVAAAGCSNGPKITVANHSDHMLQNVTVSGSGFTATIAEVTPGSTESIVVHPHGESSVRITFEADGKHIDSGDCCYFEDNSLYTIAVSVSHDLEVVAASTLRKY
jgi:hypothetical protein